MPEPDQAIQTQRAALQQQFNERLRETPDQRVRSNFSEYGPDDSAGLTAQFYSAAAAGGLAGLEAVLEEFDRLVLQEDWLKLQHALLVFLTHHPLPAEWGVYIPSLAERSPSLVRPSHP